MDIKDIYIDKGKIIEHILDEGYSVFEGEMENDKNYSLSTDEIAELYYELIKMELERMGIKSQEV